MSVTSAREGLRPEEYMFEPDYLIINQSVKIDQTNNNKANVNKIKAPRIKKQQVPEAKVQAGHCDKSPCSLSQTSSTGHVRGLEEWPLTSGFPRGVLCQVLWRPSCISLPRMDSEDGDRPPKLAPRVSPTPH